MEGHRKFLGEGGVLKVTMLEAKLEFPGGMGGGGGALRKNPWGEYGYFLEPHIVRKCCKLLNNVIYAKMKELTYPKLLPFLLFGNVNYCVLFCRTAQNKKTVSTRNTTEWLKITIKHLNLEFVTCKYHRSLFNTL